MATNCGRASQTRAVNRDPIQGMLLGRVGSRRSCLIISALFTQAHAGPRVGLKRLGMGIYCPVARLSTVQQRCGQRRPHFQATPSSLVLGPAFFLSGWDEEKLGPLCEHLVRQLSRHLTRHPCPDLEHTSQSDPVELNH